MIHCEGFHMEVNNFYLVLDFCMVNDYIRTEVKYA